ncbi:uncharacterized protein LOC128993553 [Macrosteles quadrilineatus]|uniref:uncharacterized protein LOC128993553 n=1 Tax=Macrosteles quadrilineatus TaxID=74068 RepID=UPI0023E23B25|nr:uncharacterized protein LOC128993553 [Macrosteles quadrilineatus]
MFKFLVIYLWLCDSHQVWNAPIIKASGVKWTEPKGNGKGNLTIIMIPQNNSCNDTDMLIAVKSDYQILSQDTQLLNLVINECQNNTLNESKSDENHGNGAISKNLNEKWNHHELHSENSSWVNFTDYNVQHKQATSPNLTANKDGISIKYTECIDRSMSLKTTPFTRSDQKDVFGLDSVNHTTKAYQNQNTSMSGLSKSYIPNTMEECPNQNYSKNELFLKDPKHYTELRLLKDSLNLIQLQNSQSDQINSPAKDNMNLKADTQTHGNLLRYRSSANEEEQHAELIGKGANHANFYEPDKKHFKQANKQSNTNPSEINDVFKFLRAVNGEPTTNSIRESIPAVLKVLGVSEATPVEVPKEIGSGITGNNSVSTNHFTVSNKNAASNIFYKSESKVFPFSNNKTEPIDRMTIHQSGEVSNNTNTNMKSFDNRFNEVVDMINKIKQEHLKEESNSRSDLLSNNQAELVASEEGEFDSKGKVQKEDFPGLSSDEAVLKKQLIHFLNSNLNDETQSDGSGNLGNEHAITTLLIDRKINTDDCVTNSQNTSFDSLSGKEIKGNVSYSKTDDTVSIKSKEPTKNTTPLNDAENTDPYVLNTNGTVPQTTLGTYNTGFTMNVSADVIKNIVTTGNESQITTISPMSKEMLSASPICKTSIIYICDPQNVTETTEPLQEKVEETVPTNVGNETSITQAVMQESLMKITLTPKIDCVSYLKSKQLSILTTKDPNTLSDQEEGGTETAVLPLLESAMFLTNNREIPNGKNIPIFVNSSSNDHQNDELLTRHDEKLAKFHASDVLLKKDLFGDMPPKIYQVNDKIRNKIPMISLKPLNNEQGVYSAQVRVAGSNLIVNQMPSYRSEKFKKVCESTSSNNTQNEELDADGDEYQEFPGNQSTTKPKAVMHVTSTSNESDGRSHSSSSHLLVDQTITPQPDIVSKVKDKNYTKKSSLLTSTTAPKQSEVVLKEMETVLKSSINHHTASKPYTTPSTKRPGSYGFGDDLVLNSSPITKFKNEGVKPSTISHLKTNLTTRKPLPSSNSLTTFMSKEEKSTMPQNENDFSNKDSCITLWNGGVEDGSAQTTKWITRKPNMKEFLNDDEIQINRVAPVINYVYGPSSSFLNNDLIRKDETKTSSERKMKDSENVNPTLDDRYKSMIKEHSSEINEQENLSGFHKHIMKIEKCNENHTPSGQREIVIQILRNTKNPSRYNAKENDVLLDDSEIPTTAPVLKIKNPFSRTYSKGLIKPGGYEIEVPGAENINKLDLNQRHSEHTEEETNKEGNSDKCCKKSQSSRESNVGSMNFEIESNENAVQEIPKNSEVQMSILKQRQKVYKPPYFNDLKLVIDPNNAINIT